MSSPQNGPKYSVLILGSTQAGKSTLIEHIRSYSDPGYAIDKSLLGDGITSKTDTTTPFLIESKLPTYEAYWKDTGVAVELKNFAAQYQDEENYRDALLSHSDDVGMRLVPQDTTAPFGSMEFRLLDTPGFNSTEDRHSEQATSIVNEVISTRSFNLIVFVISAKVPLTEEKQLALEYFAYVLRGFHSRIVFLYTHVDYADTHHSNTTYHLDMLMRSKTISRIFRRHDGESVFDEFNIVEYPCLNIDLTTKNRPIVQCMIRNTIREILTMATAPPVVLDTSTSNIERIHTATYPTEFGQDQRKNLKATLRRNLAKPKYSVLIMGKTQAGKSTLIEHIKNYANPGYAIDWSLLGNGKLSKSESTRPFYVESNLPVYEVYRRHTGEVIDLDDLPSKFDDEEDYRDILFSRERDVGLRLVHQDPNNPSDNIEFRLLDSLGLKYPDENDNNDTFMIIDKLIHIQTFNLIVITESYKNLLTQEQQLALEYYANVFKGLHSRIMFLHTHVAYTDMHPTNRTHHLNMRMKNKALSKLFRRYDNEVPFDRDNFEEYPSLTIDLVSKKRPVITCLIRNTVREILKMATRPAVLFDTSIQNIERIRAIPYPTQFTNEQLKQSKVRLQEDVDNFEEVQAKVQEEKPVEESPSGNSGIVPPIVSGPHPHLPGIVGGVSGGAIIGGAIASHKKRDKETQQETVVTEVLVETGSSKPTVSKSSSWFKKPIGGTVAVGAGAIAVAGGTVVAGAGAVKSGAHHVSSGVHQVASGAGSAAACALEKVDGVRKRTVQVLTSRKAHVDAIAPIAKTSYVYYDDEVYDAVLTEKHTGVTYVTQLLFDTQTNAYYVYVRWGESEYRLDGPHETIESAKAAFLITYHDQFGVEWQTRETTVSERWTYEVKTYELFEEIEEVEEIVEETEAVTIIEQQHEIVVQEQSEHVEVTEGEEIIKVVTTVKETGVVAEPAVSKGTSWFRRLASGAGAVASGALTEVDGVWKRTVQVLTTRKAHVDKVAPIAETSYVYYDEEVYDSVLVEKSTGITYVTQLLFDTKVQKYYVYVRWGETDYKLDGSHDTIEAAKAAFQITYKERFGLEWATRETTVSERWTYEVRTYETFEETEEIEEIVEDYEVKEIVAREKQVIVEGKVISTEQSVSSSHDDTVVRTVSEQVVSKDGSASGSSSSRGDAFGFGGSSSYEYTQIQSEESKKSTFLANLPTLNAGINADTSAATGVIDLTSGTAENFRELPAHLRPRAWVSLHVGGWQNAPHELQGFMRLDDQSGQRLMETARDESLGKAQESIPIDNLSLPVIVGLFAQKLYRHFGEELPKELEDDFCYVTKESTKSGEIRKVTGAVITGSVAATMRHGTQMVQSDSVSCGEESSAPSSVLILGKTQAGKSAFIEFVKNYANQQYTIDESLLGTRFRSKTQMPVQFVVKTDLLAYEVLDATGTRIDISTLGDQYQDPDDYFDALNDRKTTLKSVPHDPASSHLSRDVEITFLDTPGVEDTYGRDAEHAERIIDAMTQMQSFNLIIIIINCEDTPSKAHQLAFNYYSKVIHTFQGHHSNVIFLYTHVEYEKCHHSNADHLSVMKLRHKAFSQLFQCQGSYNHDDVSRAVVEPYPMYNIDLDKRQRPIIKCMRLMTLREILTRVVNSPAVALDTSASNLQRIRAITHPDELNQAQRKQLLQTGPIMEQGQGPQDCITVSICARTLEDNSSGACNKDRATDLFVCGQVNDWQEYFSETMTECSSSGEEDEIVQMF